MTAACASVAIALTGIGPAGAVAQARPNVVVVMSDDQTARSMRFMDVVNSRIGNRGATFPRSFTNWGLCCPSRATFFTGQYAINHDVRGNGAPTGGYTQFRSLHHNDNLATWLDDGGYRTGFVGKYLNGYGEAEGSNPTEVPPGWDRWIGVGKKDQDVYDYPLNQNGRLVHYGRKAKAFKGDVLTRKALKFIKGAPESKPFFLFVGYTAPHAASGPDPNPRRPHDCDSGARPAPRHADAFNRLSLPQPPNFNERDVSDKPAAIQELPRIDRDRIRKRARGYRCRIESLLHIDEGVGRMVRALRRTGELKNTLIVYTSDNGFFHGEHRIPRRKNQVYEEAIRVPLLMRGPGIPRNVSVRDMAVNADLTATILDVAGANPGHALDGRSLMQAARRPRVERGRELLVERGNFPSDPERFVAIRNRRYAYAEHGTGEVELYDLARDPFQLDSKHDNPGYNKAQAALEARLDDLRECSGQSCLLVPELDLELEFETGQQGGRTCAEPPVRARVDGPDEDEVDKVKFKVNGDPVATAKSAPFVRRLPHSKLTQRRRSTVRAVVDMEDGRRRTLSDKVRACR